ncbi:signal recognition particle-docking protein FtsY [Romboutsia sedimentorum]|uniref:Signal recognition particle receptor FtsY n=1 Tax=Romboutsia sedimentorum TaxID=1368474 RepID=A0ABT7EB81_9FIRM|nr:signal recognition particle-docking protein FtsY [Romboutsia sedimentorum]MDK2563211.1 signal recognition particle-docking protein FtsY [Romboutsia sedimentorum]MDK2584938.1 signal recognition particle-docking protein FtsY [Romboutsia sedimentorum]
MFKKLFKFGKKKDDNEEIEKLNETEDTNDVAKEITEEENTNKEQKIETNIQEPITEKDKELIEEEIKQDEENTKSEAEEEPKQDKIEQIEVIEELSQEDDKEENNIEETIEEEKISLFDRLKQGLSKAKQGITDRIDEVLKSYTKVDEELLEELEEILITADVGVNTTMDIIEQLRVKIKQKGITDPMDVRVELKAIVEEILTNDNSKLDVSHSPTIILMVGVNGVGKTTTIGKLANKYKKDGKKVLLAAGDTFRAAAIEQLEVWSSRSNVDIIKHQEGADPGAVIFDAVKAAKARNVDVLICDTAGRLHNKANLMNELGKVFKIVDREFPEAKKEVLLVVDATTGQNAVSQAKTFKEVAQITGIVLTKLDGTAKGGVVIAVKSEVDVPVKLIGVGETVEDLQDFDAKAFSDALFGK